MEENWTETEREDTQTAAQAEAAADAAADAKPVPKYARTYTGYPRRFLAYRWYKPLLTALLAGVVYLILEIIVVAIATLAAEIVGMDLLSTVVGGYETMDVYSAPGALATLGSIAAFLPALAFAASVVKDRPYSSYSSARGGWDHSVFFKCFAAAMLVRALPLIVLSLLDGRSGPIRFTVIGLLACTVLGPLQCVAEEYLFRGLIMQTVGAWCRLPLLAVLVQAVVFASQHPYNMIGVIDILLDGVVFGVAALLAKGLEGSSALHVANNMTAFYMVGFGFGEISSTLEVSNIILSLVTGAAYLVLLYFLGKKRGWFDRAVRDDVTPFNAATEERLARKAERKAAKRGGAD